MLTRLAVLLYLLTISLTGTLAQQPGYGAKVWEDIRAKYPKQENYLVMFSYERHAPMTRSAPEQAIMTYSDGKFVAILPEITWYFNGDTLWEYVAEANEVSISDRPSENALAPSEILEILQRPPVSARHHGYVDYNGEQCDKIKLDFRGRSLPFAQVYIWVNPDREMKKIIFVDQWQTTTTIVIHSIRKTETPDDSKFRFSSRH